MKKTIAVTIILVLLSGCTKQQPKNRLVFSHLSFTSYMWGIETGASESSNRWHLTIASYIRIDSSGTYQLARREGSWTGEFQYFKGILPSDVDTLLNRLSEITSDSNYIQRSLMPELYHGPTFSVILERAKRNPTVVEYNPIIYPRQCEQVFKYLPHLALTMAGTKTEPFDFKPVTDLLVRYDNLWTFHLPDSLMLGPLFVTD